jgi:hypothetical protein
MNYLFYRIWNDIKKSRKAGNERYLFKGHVPDDIYSFNKEMFFACPYKENGYGV